MSESSITSAAIVAINAWASSSRLWVARFWPTKFVLIPYQALHISPQDSVTCFNCLHTFVPACLVLGCLCQSAHPLVVVLRASIASRPLFIQTHTMHVIQSVSHLWTRGASTTFLIYSSLTLLRGGWGRGRGNGAAAVIYSCMCISWMLRIVLRELCIHGSVFGGPGISLAAILSLLFSQWIYVGWWTIYFIKLWSILIAETLIFNSIFGDGGKQDAQKFPGLQPNQQKRNSGGVGGWKFTSRTWEKK